MDQTDYYDKFGRYVGTKDNLGFTFWNPPAPKMSSDEVWSQANAGNHFAVNLARGLATPEMARGMASILRVAIVFFIVVASFLIFVIVSCLPMWQRICIHPNVIRLHMKRAKTTALCGGLLFLPKLIQAVTGFELPVTNTAYQIGTVLLPLAIFTLLLGFGQRALSNRYRYWAHGAGFGLPNFINLLSNRPPTRTWTHLQDALLIGLVIWGFLFPGPFFWGSIGSILMLLILLPYTWFCQVKYSNGKAVAFC